MLVTPNTWNPVDEVRVLAKEPSLIREVSRLDVPAIDGSPLDPTGAELLELIVADIFIDPV